MNYFLKISIFLAFLFIQSCTKDNPQVERDYMSIDTKDFLYNLPIIGDTIFSEPLKPTDFRVEIEGHRLDSVEIYLDGYLSTKISSPSIISTSNCFTSIEGNHEVVFKFKTILQTDTVYYQSKKLTLKVIPNLANKFIKTSCENGRLNIAWPEFDKKHTKSYFIARYIGNEFEYKKEIINSDSLFIDSLYVGENVNYEISIINKYGGKQRIWYFNKPKEHIQFYFSQKEKGYELHFDKCKYYNNFEEYEMLEDEFNNNVIFQTTEVNDTSFYFKNAKFGDEARIILKILPKRYPNGVSKANWDIYGEYLVGSFAETSFEYSKIQSINDEELIYTANGKIYKKNYKTNEIIDSITQNVSIYFSVTPKGDYVYSFDPSSYGTLNFWDTKSLSLSHSIPSITSLVASDNLIGFGSNISGTTDNKLKIFDIKNGNTLFETNYQDYEKAISSSGKYFFVNDFDQLKLYIYDYNVFSLIWEDTGSGQLWNLYDFDPLDEEICYTWNEANQFSTKRTADFTKINSFYLPLDYIVNIDYNTKQIMGFRFDNIQIYDLETGTLKYDIPSNTNELTSYGDQIHLIENTIYSNQGLKYLLY